jgi:hypothetical protein
MSSPLTRPIFVSLTPEKIVVKMAKIISALEAGNGERDIIPPLL